MNNSTAFLQYTEQSGLTASPGELLIMLFNAEIKNIKIAILNIKAGNIAEANAKLIKAQDIINELIVSLDFRYAIAKELRTLYGFINRELIAANVKKDAGRLEQLLPLIIDLKDTWEKADRLAKKQV